MKFSISVLVSVMLCTTSKAQTQAQNPTQTFIQRVSGTASASTGSASITGTFGAGHLLFIDGTFTNTNSITSTNNGSVYVQCPNCSQTVSGTGTFSAGYILSSTATSNLVINFTPASGTVSWIVRDYSYAGGVMRFDSSNSSLTSVMNPYAGQSLTISGTNELIIQIVLVPSASGFPTNIANPYHDYHGGGAVADADYPNATSFTNAIWTVSSPSGTGSVISIAFAQGGANTLLIGGIGCHSDTAIGQNGVGFRASVSVFGTGSTNLVSPMFQNVQGSIGLQNPMQSSANGRFMFCTGSGIYDIQVSGVGIAPYTYTILIPDWTSATLNQSIHFLTYDSTNTVVQYDCASQIQSTASQWSINNGTLTQISVTSGVATATFTSVPYLYSGALITITGATTSSLNSSSVPVSGTSGSTVMFNTSAPNGTYNNSTLSISTNYPLLNQSLWIIQVYVYDSNDNVIVTKQAGFNVIPKQLSCLNLTSY